MNLESMECFEKSIRKNPRLIGELKDPTRELLEMAIKASPVALKFIKSNMLSRKKVDVEIIYAALREMPHTIEYIINPTEEMQRIAITFGGSDIVRRIWKGIGTAHGQVSEEIQILVVQKDPLAISHLYEPTEKTIRLACEKDPSAVVCLEGLFLDLRQQFYEKHEDKEQAVEMLFWNVTGNTYQLQKWLIQQDYRNVLRIPRDKLYKQFKKKHAKLLALERVRIL